MEYVHRYGTVRFADAPVEQSHRTAGAVARWVGTYVCGSGAPGEIELCETAGGWFGFVDGAEITDDEGETDFDSFDEAAGAAVEALDSWEPPEAGNPDYGAPSARERLERDHRTKR